MTKRELAIDVAKKFLNLPYKWGGNDAVGGFDCSGLVVEVLQSVGIIGADEDYTAHVLGNLFYESDILQPGNLVFWDWDKDGKKDHVEMIAFVDDSGEVYTIGASGGGSATTTKSAAIAQDAFVKIRPLRSGYVLVTDPYQ